MSIFSNNLRFLRSRKGLNLDEFEFLGIKKGTMSNYELGKTEPKFDLLLELSKFFGISIDDFLTRNIEESHVQANVQVDVQVTSALPPESGKTTSIKNSKDETNPAPFFMPSSGKTTSTKIIEVPVPIEDDSEMVSIPVVDISVAAGSGFYNADYLSEVDSIRFPRSMVKGGQPHICVRIKGESMVPTLQDGGYLIIRLLDRSEWRDVREGHVYVVSSTEGRAFVKRLKNRFKDYGFIVCMSDNPDPMGYPNFNLMADEINTIWHAEWYISAKMPNIHNIYYKKVGELEDKYEGVMEEIQQIRREIKAIARS